MFVSGKWGQLGWGDGVCVGGWVGGGFKRQVMT